MGYRKILVALDRSPQSEAIFAIALSLAQQNFTHLMLLHCLSLQEQDEALYLNGTFPENLETFSVQYGQIMQACLSRELAKIEQWLGEYRDRAIAFGIPSEQQCHVEAPGRSIVQLARRWEADLILLGRRGRRGLAEMVLGSVSNYVLHNAPCSVLIVQERPTVEQQNPPHIQSLYPPDAA